ncbi:MAG: hypothetical protein ABI882_16520, partial [Acidobacteriota bacterium]
LHLNNLRAVENWLPHQHSPVTGSPMHLTSQQVELLVARQLEPQELLTVTRHLDVCNPCRSLIGSHVFDRVLGLQSELHDATADNHLAYEELAGYVDDLLTLENRTIVARHLTACAECSAAVGELTALGRSLSRSGADARTNSRGTARKTAGPWRDSRWKTLLVRGVAVTSLVALIATIALVWRYSKLSEQVPVLSSASPSQMPAVVKRGEPVPSPAARAATILTEVIDGSGRISLDDDGKVSGLSDVSAAELALVKRALAEHQVPRSQALRALKSRVSRLMSESREGITFALLSPLATTVQTDRPVFRWQPLQAAASYTVTILDTNFNVVVTSESLEGTSWTVTQSLARDSRYLWQVTALLSGGQLITAPSTPAPEARFQVLSSTRTAALHQAVESHIESHLLKGLLYAEAGVMDEANRELRALLKANPKSAVVEKLVDDLRSIRR